MTYFFLFVKRMGTIYYDSEDYLFLDIIEYMLYNEINRYVIGEVL